MKLTKLLLSLFITVALSGCSNSGTPTSSTSLAPQTIEVESITTDKPMVTANTSNSCALHYTIRPYNASDKSITVDTTYLKDIADITVDDYYHVFVWGKKEGSGLVSLTTSNGKYVSFSITVIDTEPAPSPDPEVRQIDRIANYINDTGASEGVSVHYILEQEHWVGQKNFGYSTDDSRANLERATYFVKAFLPNYLFRYAETYGDETGRNELELLMVNSNISVAVLITSYIENENLITDILIESMW